MTAESPSRRKFIKWAVSSFVLAHVVPTSKALETPAQTTAQLNAQGWADLSAEQRAKILFSRQLPAGAQLLASSENVGVVAAIFETEAETSGVVEAIRWLCIAPECAPGTHSVQVTADAMAVSTSVQPVDASLSVLDDGSVEVSEQHLRSHDKHVWVELDGKWCLKARSFAGNVAHRFVTHDYDMTTEQFVVTTSLIESDDILAMECVRTDALIKLGTYCNGQILT